MEATSSTKNYPLYLNPLDPSKGLNEGGIPVEIFVMIISYLDEAGKAAAWNVSTYWRKVTFTQVSSQGALINNTIRIFVARIREIKNPEADEVKYPKVIENLEKIIETNPVLGSVSLIQVKEKLNEAQNLFLEELVILEQPDLMQLLGDYGVHVKENPSSFSKILSIYIEAIRILNDPANKDLEKVCKILYELLEKGSFSIANLLKQTPSDRWGKFSHEVRLFIDGFCNGRIVIDEVDEDIEIIEIDINLEKKLFLIDLLQKECSLTITEEVPIKENPGEQPCISKRVTAYYDYAVFLCLGGLIEKGIDSGNIGKLIEIINKYSFKTIEMREECLDELVESIKIHNKDIDVKLIDTIKDEQIKKCLRKKYELEEELLKLGNLAIQTRRDLYYHEMKRSLGYY
jgi:hypothetical protein